MQRTNTKNRLHVPMRSCVGCRERAAKADLVRVVVSGDQAVVDPMKRLPGRGAYVHELASCIAAAVKRGGLNRSFRRRVETTSLEQVGQVGQVGQFLRSREEGQS